MRKASLKPLIEKGVEGLKEAGIVGGTAFHDTTSLDAIVKRFPDVKTTIGYGSGVFAQDGYEGKKRPQIDMVHVVKSTRDFHLKNLEANRGHYSGLKFGGLRLIEYVQKMGVGLYYNPFVNINGNIVKYGVMGQKTALRDIVEWNNLYLAGRLQKPVKFIGDNLISQVNLFNLRNATIVSLLIKNQQKISKSELYETITSLSYLGDFRMIIGGENPHKVRNIVSKQLALFNKLYEPVFEQLSRERILKITGTEVDVALDSEMKYSLINQLPLNFRNKLFETYTNDKATLIDERLPEKIVQTIRRIILWPSIVQGLKGIFTAGVYKSLSYIIEKRMKYISSKKN